MSYSEKNIITNTNNKFVAAIFLITSIAFYVLGIIEPLMSTKYQVLNIPLKSQEITLFDSIRMFWSDGEYLVSVIIFCFTFLLPSLKYVELGLKIYNAKKYKALKEIDKWNMIDVFLVALLLLNLKMNSSFIVMQLEMGTNYIALAVLTRILTIVTLDHLPSKQVK